MHAYDRTLFIKALIALKNCLRDEIRFSKIALYADNRDVVITLYKKYMVARHVCVVQYKLQTRERLEYYYQNL